VHAKFANIGGLKVRGPVKSAGVVVGRVADIRFDNESYEAIVSMTLDLGYQFPRDTTAKILTSGILGEQYVGLEAGGDGVMLKHGDRLRLTQSAVVLENLISQFLFNKAAEGKEEKDIVALMESSSEERSGAEHVEELGRCGDTRHQARGSSADAEHRVPLAVERHLPEPRRPSAYVQVLFVRPVGLQPEHAELAFMRVGQRAQEHAVRHADCGARVLAPVA